MKIYRTIFTSIDMDDSDHTTTVTTFFNRENAIKYYKEQLKNLKAEQEELDMNDYCVDEDETSYQRYLDGRYMEQSVSLWLEEDDTYDELVIKTEQKIQNEKDNDYEM